MNVIQRVNLALRVAFFGQKAIATMLPTWKEGQPEYSPTNFESMVKHGYRKNELIFTCISKTAKTAASVHLSIKNKSDMAELPDHPLAKLIQRPNHMMSEFDFWASVIIYQMLAGRAVYEKERNNRGDVIALWPLRPDWLKPVKGSTTPIIGYIYTPPGFEDKPIPLELEDVLDFQLFDPLNRYHGWPPVAVAARVGDVDNATTDYLKLFFEKGGTPPGILKTVQKLNDVAVADIRRRWRERYGGMEHWLEPAVLDSDAEYQAIGSSFKDMGFEALDARSEARICMVLDVPPIIVGAKVGLDRSTFSNYGEARQSWWEDSLVPQYRNMEDTIINGLVSEYGDGITAEWDFSRVAAFQEDINARWARATAAWSADAITRNQFSQQVGIEETPDGDVYHYELVSSAPLLAVPTEGETDTDEEGKYLLSGHSHKARKPPDDDLRREIEGKWGRIMSTYLEGFQDRLEDELVSLHGANGNG